MSKPRKTAKTTKSTTYDAQKAIPGKTGDTQKLSAKVAAATGAKATPGFKEFGIAAKEDKKNKKVKL